LTRHALLAARWALRVTDEFYAQGDAERAADLPISVRCDRRQTSRVAAQLAFKDV